MNIRGERSLAGDRDHGPTRRFFIVGTVIGSYLAQDGCESLSLSLNATYPVLGAIYNGAVIAPGYETFRKAPVSTNLAAGLA